MKCIRRKPLLFQDAAICPSSLGSGGKLRRYRAGTHGMDHLTAGAVIIQTLYIRWFYKSNLDSITSDWWTDHLQKQTRPDD